MEAPEFARIMAYLEAGCGKPLAPKALDVYFDCLHDLPIEVLQIAAKRVVMEHKWATFPSIAELRQAASETARGKANELSPAEAWEKAWYYAGQIDLDLVGQTYVKILGGVREEHSSQFAYVTKGCPPLILEAMRAFGIPALCSSTDPVGVVRGQFMKIYEQLAARDRRVALLPEKLKDSITSAPDRLGEMRHNLAQIGVMPK